MKSFSKTWKRFTSTFILIFAVFMCLGTSSCNYEHKNATASFSISKQAIQGILKDIKNWSDDDNNAFCYIITSHGDYEETWSGYFDFDKDNYRGQAVLKNLPVGAELSFTVNTYVVRKGVNYLIFDFTGESEPIVISEGENRIKVKSTDSKLTFVLENLPEVELANTSFKLMSVNGSEEFPIKEKDRSFENGKLSFSLNKGDLMSNTSNSAILGNRYRLEATLEVMTDDGMAKSIFYTKEFILESGTQEISVMPARTETEPSNPTDPVDPSNPTDPTNPTLPENTSATPAKYIGPVLGDDGNPTPDGKFDESSPVSLGAAVSVIIGEKAKDIMLIDNAYVTEPLLIEKDTVINMNGKTIYWDGNTTASLFNIANGASLVIWDSSESGSACITSTSSAETGSIAENHGYLVIKDTSIQKILTRNTSLIYSDGYFTLFENVKIEDCWLPKEGSSLIRNDKEDAYLYCQNTTIERCLATVSSGIESNGSMYFIGGHIDNSNTPNIEVAFTPTKAKSGALTLGSSKDTYLVNAYMHSANSLAETTAFVSNEAHLHMSSTVAFDSVYQSSKEYFNYSSVSAKLNLLTQTFRESRYSNSAIPETYTPDLQISTVTTGMTETQWGEFCYRTGTDPVEKASYYGDDAIVTVISFGEDNETFENTMEKNKCTGAFSYSEDMTYPKALVLGESEASRGYLHINSRSTIYGLVGLKMYSYIQQTGNMGALPEFPIKIDFSDEYDSQTFDNVENPFPVFLADKDTKENPFTLANAYKANGTIYFAIYNPHHSWNQKTLTIEDNIFTAIYPNKDTY